mgnify:CR=1 FL=1
MRRLALSLSLALSLVSSVALAQKSYVREDLSGSAIRLEDSLKKAFSAGAQGRAAGQLQQEAGALLARDPRRAYGLFGTAVTVDPAAAGAWLGFARAALRIEPRDGGEGYRLREQAASAGYKAYQLARTRPEEGAALAEIGAAAARGEQWRLALNAYRASLERAESAALRATYQEMRGKHGFRVSESEPYKVDSDAASPRVCVQFTETLARGKVDFAPYVAVSGASSPAVTAEEQQICIDGLRHGERYTVVVRQGLPSDVGEALLKTSDFDIYVRDRSPQVRFTGRNYVLPRVGQEGLPVVSVNTHKVHVAIARIGDRSLLPTVRGDNFLKQLDASEARRIAKETGFDVWRGTLDVKPEQNRDVTTAFPVQEAVKGLEPGVYVMTAWPDGLASAKADPEEESYESRATQWFIVSDLGLTAVSARDGVHVFARSLASAKAVEGLTFRLVARNNEVLAEARSDASGHVRFDPGLARGKDGLAPGMVVATDGKGDYGFLDLQQGAFDLTDRGVKGRLSPGPLDAFVFAERGVYRSGENVYLTALLRDGQGAAVPGLPLTLVVQRPDGVEYRRMLAADQGLGGRSATVPLLAGAARGAWRVKAFADPKGAAIGEATFMVEDYVPERLAVTLTPAEPSLKPGQPAEIAVAADYLYGAPGGGLEVSGEVTVRTAEKGTVPGHADYSFGIEDEAFEPVNSEIEDRGTTDARGRVTMSVALPDATAPRALEAKIALRVGEPGGRAVERSVTLPIRPAGAVLAAKKLFRDAALNEGDQAGFDVLALSTDGTKLARSGVTWSLMRVDRRYQWFFKDGQWSFEAIKSTRKVLDGRIDLTAEGPGRIAVPVAYGQYRLDLNGDGGVLPASIGFSVGWSGEGTAATPDMLDTRIDKARYGVGETMTVTLSPRFAGTAVVLIAGDSVSETRFVEVGKDGASLTLPVKAEWGSGAYVVALAHRPLDTEARRMPGRSLGVAWFGIDGPGRALDVAIGTPERVRPRGTLAVPVRLGGLKPGEEAYVTVAAVDVGILNLTRYLTPDVSGHVFGQKQLGAELRDLYGYLIDGMQGTRGAIRSGGDGASAKLDGAPPTQEPLARYSGVVKVGPDGTASVDFDLPAFNGTARVMVAAWSATGAGQGEKDVIIRDPVVVAGTMPRFLNVGDQSRFHLAIDNLEGKAGNYQLDLDVEGPVIVAAEAARRTVQIAAGAKTALTIPVKAGGVGTARLTLRMTGPDIDVSQAFSLTVLPGAPEVFHRSVRTIQPGQSVTLASDLLGEFMPGTGMLSLAASGFGGIDVPALLAALDRYPYGCTEQTVSRAMPLLSLSRLRQAAGATLPLPADLDGTIRGAIDRILARQSSSGGFGLWSADGAEDMWLDAFVGDFLTRARERNFDVPQKAFDLVLDRMRNFVANASEVREGGSDLAYAAYVLARNGRPVMNDLRYLADTKIAEFKTPLAQAQLAAALGLLGDRGRATAVFRTALETLDGETVKLVSRADYGSKLRDGAGLLALAAEAGAGGGIVQKAAAVVSEARGATRFTSTQENAWMVMAAEAMASEAQGQSLTLNGTAHRGPFYRAYLGTRLDGAPVTLANTGAAPVQLVVTASGHPMAPEPALNAGFGLERTFHKLDGTKLDSLTVRQNDRVVVVLKVTEPEAKFGRLVLTDLLPAGLEIDNPALVDSGGLEGFSWLKREIEPENTEFRDDRFVAAFTRNGSGKAEYQLAYVVRAVSPGTYALPAAVIEDMYRPERYGRTGHGTLTVTAR